jgi:tetratricopeptide (TPR) repeat protein
MLLIMVMLFTELTRTSGFIDIPTVPEYDMPGVFGGSMMLAIPWYSENPTGDSLDAPDPMDFNMAFKYGFGKGELALSAYQLNTYAMSVSYLLKKEKGAAPALFCGVDDISYSPYVSTRGIGGDKGFLDEVGYYRSPGGRVWELFSAYFAMQKTVAPFTNLVIGLGRGRFMGNSWRSHLFNTDLFITGSDYSTEKFSPWALGLFMGGSLRFPFGLEMSMEMDGRDANLGMKYRTSFVTATCALTKVEYLGNFRPFSPRMLFGLEASNKSVAGAPKIGSIECVIQDQTTKGLLTNAIIDIKEINKRYKATGGTFSLSLPMGNYTITATRADYVDYIAKISVKAAVKSKFVFNLKKTEEAMKRDLAFREREVRIAESLNQGKAYFAENNIVLAKKSFDAVIALDSANAEARDYLSRIELKKTELLAVYANEAKQRAKAKDYKKAIEYWQKVLELDAANAEATAAIADLNKQLAAAPPKKPTTVTKPPVTPPKKATAEEIAALYNKGVNYFSQGKYDEALKTFKQVLALDPNHKGAKDYKKRTETRLKAIKGG